MDTTSLNLTQLLSVFSLGQVCLLISLSLFFPKKSDALNLLTLLFVTIGLLILQPVIQLLGPSYEIVSLLVMLPALLTLGPLLWLYIESLTSEWPWQWSAAHSKHFLLSILGVICAFLTWMLPEEVKLPLLTGSGAQMSTYVGILMTFAFVLIMGWTLQSGFYLWRITKHLLHYHKRLKQHFSNNDNRELHWVSAVLVFFCLAWVIAVSNVFMDNLSQKGFLDSVGGTLLALSTVWVLGLFGLRQAPGFEGRYLPPDDRDPTYSQQVDKYSRSALTEQDAKRIGDKIEQAMRNQKLYLQPDISLTKLSQALNTSPNYVSQTLNESLGYNFFDYINKWRITEALPLILEGKKSVLDIAMEVGFNARSSFYTAFKQHTGVTPGEYRKQNKQS